MPEGDQTKQATWTAQVAQAPAQTTTAPIQAEAKTKSSIPSHSASLISNYTKADNTKWTKFTEICTIYENEKWGLMLRIPKWMILTGDIYIAPISNERKQLMQDAIEAKKARQAEQSHEDEDDLPFS